LWSRRRRPGGTCARLGRMDLLLIFRDDFCANFFALESFKESSGLRVFSFGILELLLSISSRHFYASLSLDRCACIQLISFLLKGAFVLPHSCLQKLRLQPPLDMKNREASARLLSLLHSFLQRYSRILCFGLLVLFLCSGEYVIMLGLFLLSVSMEYIG